ncbi:MAG: hypothetical protein KKD48_04640 [Nanoarchaeota archaeon]|nr:hypothetical protein [Nanoarchaeota archaeon]
MKKMLLLSLFLIVSLIVIIPDATAHCPLCTGAAVAGVEVARVIGVDDSIVGLLLGAVIISSALWFNKWLKKKIDFPLQEIIIVILSLLMIIIPFYYAGIITNAAMVKSMPDYHSMFGLGIFGIDKLMIGIIIGSIAVWSAFTLSDSIKKQKGKVLWPYQGLSFMLIILFILSLIFWLITK